MTGSRRLVLLPTSRSFQQKRPFLAMARVSHKNLLMTECVSANVLKHPISVCVQASAIVCVRARA